MPNAVRSRPKWAAHGGTARRFYCLPPVNKATWGKPIFLAVPAGSPSRRAATSTARQILARPPHPGGNISTEHGRPPDLDAREIGAVNTRCWLLSQGSFF